MRSGWAWFFAGTTLALAMALAALVWVLVSSGLYGQLVGRVSPSAAAPPSIVAAAVPTATPLPPASAAATPAAFAPVPVPSVAAAAAQRSRVLSSGHWKLLIGDVK